MADIIRDLHDAWCNSSNVHGWGSESFQMPVGEDAEVMVTPSEVNDGGYLLGVYFYGMADLDATDVVAYYREVTASSAAQGELETVFEWLCEQGDDAVMRQAVASGSRYHFEETVI